ncbi:lipoprotein [Actinoplanes sp. NPDC051859]|uniref:lipoprotein n=1 Tax=Actinoplanes sp. NPDC051859 TaxID=3363909 RepID=UPI00379F9A13
MPAVATGLTKDCQAAAESVRTLIKDMITQMAAGAKDDYAGLRKALAGYAATARSQAAGFTDAGLRTAVEQQAAAAEQLSKAKDPTDMETPAFEKATSDLEKVCANALTPTVGPGTPTVRVGTADSACPLPVSFDLVALWKPKAVDAATVDALGSLASNGPFTGVCEIDGKPAGEVAFLRVYAAKTPTGSPRASVEAFVEAEAPEARKKGNYEVTKIQYSDVTIAGQPAAEVTWEANNKALDHLSKYSAFAVSTPKGMVVVKLSPFGADEYDNVLPAYEVAKKTLTVG